MRVTSMEHKKEVLKSYLNVADIIGKRRKRYRLLTTPPVIYTKDAIRIVSIAEKI
jgi:hypothetical protein